MCAKQGDAGESLPDLAGALIALLDASDASALKLLGVLLREDPVSAGPNNSFVLAALAAGLPRRLFQAVQRDRAQTDASSEALGLLLGLARGSFGHETAARRALRAERGLLHDLFHALAYQHLQAVASSGPEDAVPRLLSLTLQTLNELLEPDSPGSGPWSGNY